MRSKYRLKSYERKGSLLPGSMVDDLCLTANRKFKDLYPVEEVVFWGIHHTQNMCAHKK